MSKINIRRYKQLLDYLDNPLKDSKRVLGIESEIKEILLEIPSTISYNDMIGSILEKGYPHSVYEIITYFNEKKRLIKSTDPRGIINLYLQTAMRNIFHSFYVWCFAQYNDIVETREEIKDFKSVNDSPKLKRLIELRVMVGYVNTHLKREIEFISGFKGSYGETWEREYGALFLNINSHVKKITEIINEDIKKKQVTFLKYPRN